MSTHTRVTYEQFEAMGRRGDFDGTDDRYELLAGEIVVMTTPNPPHENVVDVLNAWSVRALPEGVIRVRVQQSLGMPEIDSLTLPDIAWMREQWYGKRRPRADDVYLIIEVAHTTLSTDRNRKGRIYAEAGIQDYWIVNIKGRTIEVRRDPQGSSYRSLAKFGPGEEVRPLAFPEVVLPVSRLFPADE